VGCPVSIVVYLWVNDKNPVSHPSPTSAASGLPLPPYSGEEDKDLGHQRSPPKSLESTRPLSRHVAMPERSTVPTAMELPWLLLFLGQAADKTALCATAFDSNVCAG
jgi:hypothetical protein